MEHQGPEFALHLIEARKSLETYLRKFTGSAFFAFNELLLASLADQTAADLTEHKGGEFPLP